MLYRSIGDGMVDVSAISLGSWNTFSRLSPSDCAALLRAAIDAGINLFDIGFYWDKPDTEAAFAESIRLAGIRRSDYQLALKLWLWNYPQQSFEQQVRASLERLRVDHVELVMVSRPTEGVDLAAFCEEIDGLVRAGLARGWGATNWEAGQIAQAKTLLQGKSHPRLVQLQYNVARREVVESEAYLQLFSSNSIGLCAAFVLEGGILAGHLDRDRVDPSAFARGERPRERNIARDAGGIRERIRALQPKLEEIAAGFGATAAQLAIAFAVAKATTALIGVTRLEDLAEDLGALQLLDRQAEWLPLLEPLRVRGVAHPRLFDPVKNE
ncbi:MAG TPA: aldo/keto reductase [Steroidobacteraceae bacterium]|jgi:L-glyceraldehyde 3-phosphate reductase|nr:aldo/keto reductase [Steroidobacteraceae bacterium]